MSKQEQYFRKIAECKERLRKLSTETLRGRLGSGFLYKEAAIAIRELIEEREQQLLDEESSAKYIRLIQKLDELHGTCYRMPLIFGDIACKNLRCSIDTIVHQYILNKGTSRNIENFA
ncbi:hypothetical protein [Chamaesiphon sp. VAR_48_metabat_403]|uniref:hypothetical protein n=1 Tax=Chamaesiphon sp. VAR_48_metabat_403 TaxID=2964700 RepID=UPI00286DA4BC|nr:hypothetical protein [Chamaesiphon sp. VAR_48_metabat_403]